MYKLKKVGISALAGSLVSLSAAQAGGVSVGGTMEMTYTTLDHNEVTGTSLGTKKNISFSGGGEFANGWTYGVLHVMNDGMSGISSSSMNINMGGIATLAYDAGTGGYGANTVDNIVPIAWEEIDYGLASGISDVGQVSKTKGVVNFTVKYPGSGTALSYSYASRMGAGHVADGGTSGGTGDGGGKHGHDLTLDIVNIDATWFGWRLGAAVEKVSHPDSCSNLYNRAYNDDAACLGQYEDEYGGTSYTSLRIGPLSAGYQMSYLDNGDGAASAVASNHSWVSGIALTIGDYISVSYGKGEDKYKYNDADRKNSESRGGLNDRQYGEHVISEFEGGSAAVNWGPLSLKYVLNSVSNVGGKEDDINNRKNTGRDRHQEVNLSMAF